MPIRVAPSYIWLHERLAPMTVRIPRSPQFDLSDDRVAALITQAILSQPQDDTPSAIDGRLHSAWLGWSNGLVRSARPEADKVD